MTPVEAERLAYAINALRPDWPRTSLQTLFASAKLATRTLHDAAIAMAWIATDRTTQTPGRVLENGPWWGATMRVASEAERHPALVQLSDLCHICGREKRHCDALDNGHDWAPRLPHVRETINAAGARKAREALAAALPPTTDTSTEEPA